MRQVLNSFNHHDAVDEPLRWLPPVFHRASANLSGCRRFLTLLAALLLTPLASATGQEKGAESGSADENAAINLHSTGIKAWEAGDYQMAIDQWNKLLSEYPNYSARLDVKFQVAQGWFKQGDYVRSATEFRELYDSIPDITTYRHGPGLLVFLGFSQYSVARETENREAALDLTRQAIANYELFHRKYPDDSLADQAWFFLGDALNWLNQLEPDPSVAERASAAFLNVLENYPESELTAQALSQLGASYEKSGKLDEALRRYNDFLERFPEHELAASVEFWAAETLRMLATRAQEAGSDGAKQQFQHAIDRYESVLQREKLEERDLALYHMAFCLLQTGDFGKAADTYAIIYNELPESKFAAASALAAGKYYISANNPERASQWLKLVREKLPESNDEATHWLCRVHIEAKEWQAAYDLASAATSGGGGGEFRVNLLMDAADALHEISDRRAESVLLYQTVAREHPDHELAPRALYFAVFGCQSLEQFDKALASARQFKQSYPESEFLPDVLQILGDAAMKTEDWALAQSTFEDLIERFPDHESRSWWATRVGWTLNLQKKHDDAIAWLSKALTTITDPVSRSEAAYVAGSSYFQNGDYDNAVQSLEQSLRDNPQRSDAGEVRLLLARALREGGDSEKAREMLANAPGDEGAAMENPVSALVLAELDYEQGNYAEAIAAYSRVIDSGTETANMASALYGRGWARIKTGEATEAIADFDRLIDTLPDNPNRNASLLGRAVARLMAGQHNEAITDIEGWLATDPPAGERDTAIYERGMNLAATDNWEKAAADFRQLAESDRFDPRSVQGDNILYQLAWALKKTGDPDGAREHFARLAKETPQSEFAAEAHFHLGESAYAAAQWDEAGNHYRQCVDSNPSDDIGERAAYKLAWCAFEQENWEEARKLFQEQVDRYPDGPLFAIGLSMVGESHFHNKNHDDAIVAWKVAIPAMRNAKVTEESVMVLAPLHAAQAANKTGDHQTALEFAQSVIDGWPDSGWLYPAMYELGAAHAGLGQKDKAIEAWQKVAENSIDKFGARARAMIGEEYFKDGQYDRAVEEFKLVVYGYPEPEDGPREIQPWKAFSSYEAARCYYVQINEASPETRADRIQKSRQWFQYLVDNFPNDVLAADARKQLQLLEDLER